MSLLDKHQNIVFQYSGGKDSIASLSLLKPYWHKLTIVHVNTGALPEHAAQIQYLRDLGLKVVEVTPNIQAQISKNGLPVDLLPVRSLPLVQHLTQQSRPKLQPFIDCCMNNLMLPMQEATKALGATLIIRGQKAADAHKSPLKDGDVVDGVQYHFPVENWTDEEVLLFIEDSPFLPANFHPSHGSLDCWFCTAYREESQWKDAYLQKHHPEKAALVRSCLIEIKKEIMAEVAKLGV